MTQAQPEALVIANSLDQEWKADALNYDTALEAAAELRRQHARIAELEAELVALKAAPAAQAVEKFPTDGEVLRAYEDAFGANAVRAYANLRVLAEALRNRVALLATPTAPVAVEPTQRVTVDFQQATDLLEMFGGEPSSVTLGYGNGHSGNGLYASYTDMPDEGSYFLGETDSDAAPQAQDVQDAVRYRWLRGNAADFLTCVVDATGRLCCNSNEADEAVDHAIAASAAKGA